MSTAVAKRVPGRPGPSDEKLERGLTALARYGSSTKASEICGIPQSTLRTWRSLYAERYEQIRRTRAIEIDEALIDEYRDLALSNVEAARQAAELGQQLMAKGHYKEAMAVSGAARNFGTTAGIATDKNALMSGKPTAITQHKTGEDVLRSLAALGHVDGTAEDVTDAVPGVD